MGNQVGDSVATVLPVVKLSGVLDILWIDAVLFKQLDEKVTFRFYIEALDKLTLHGWCTDNDDFNNNPPDVILSNSIPSGIQFGPGNYFGNLQLKGGHLRKIIRQINSGTPPWAYVLFMPAPPVTTAGHISYTISLTNDDPRTPLFDPSKQAVPTNFGTNPSPPRRGA